MNTLHWEIIMKCILHYNQQLLPTSVQNGYTDEGSQSSGHGNAKCCIVGNLDVFHFLEDVSPLIQEASSFPNN